MIEIPTAMKTRSPRKAQPSIETESDNVKHHHEERPPLPRRPTMKAPPASLEQTKWVSPNKPEQMGIKILRDTANPSPFWNHKFLSIVKQHYRECRTIQEKHPEFNYVPEHLRGKPNVTCGNLPFVENTQGENAYMAYIKKIYSMCCLINDDPTSFSTEAIPTVTRNGQIDMDKTITNDESICIYYSVDQSYAKPIAHFILWRVEQTVF